MWQFGIKLFKLHLQNAYTSNIKIYCGKEGTQGVSVTSSVVMKFIEGLVYTGSMLCADDYYTNAHLAHLLLKNPM
jgi:hypothetical protein